MKIRDIMQGDPVLMSAECPLLLKACSRVIATLSPQDSLGDAISVIRQQGRQRIPVVENGKAVGIVTFMDLARKKKL
jgi:CBS domain-containing protein